MTTIPRKLMLSVVALSSLACVANSQTVAFAPGAVRGSGPSFTPDGNTVYTFVWKEGKGHTILVSNRENGRWTPSRVADFSGVYDDLEPCVSRDGTRLLFASTRPLNGRPGHRLWVMKRTPLGWSAPQALDAPINVAGAGSGAPALAADGTLFFGSTRASRAWPWEIFVARPSGAAYGVPETLGETVNSPAFAWSHTISPDGRTLIFASERPGGHGKIDLHISREVNGAWSRARNLGSPVNTELSEVWPRFSPDGKILYFSRESEEEERIYQIDTGALRPE